jgi:hypothetical protein
MIPELRKKFNAEFSENNYQIFLDDLNSSLKWPADFRVSETPLFLSTDFTKILQKACGEIVGQIEERHFKEKSKNAIPPGLEVPGETEHPLFLQIDFAICSNANGGFIPKLIELQGFPSLYAFQYFLVKKLKKHFNIPENFTSYFNNHDEKSYLELFKTAVIAGHDPENVILLEIYPEKQKTRIDFAATEELLGVSPVCITKVKKTGQNLFYEKNGKKIPIKRIYNRVIFDELIRSGIKYDFDMRDELNVEWAGHPNWFFKISKHSLPSLKGEFVPNCFFLNEINSYPDDLHNYVLKPLYSFAGHGVEVDLTKEMLDSVNQKSNYILQQKIEYAPLIETPDGFSKVEIRMMFIWNDEPKLINNLVRMSKGKMMGVDFNKNKTWVGSSSAFHSIDD